MQVQRWAALVPCQGPARLLNMVFITINPQGASNCQWGQQFQGAEGQSTWCCTKG